MAFAKRAFRTVVTVDQQVDNDEARGERTLVTRWDPHDNDILRVLFVIVGSDQVHDLIVDDASIRVINGTVTTEQELRRLFLGGLAGRLQELAKARVGVDDVRDTLGRIEPCDLDEVIAGRPLQFSHLLFDAQAAELAHVVLRIPGVEVLVQSIEPVSGGRVNEDGHRDGNSITYQSVAAPRSVNFSGGTSLGTNLLTG